MPRQQITQTGTDSKDVVFQDGGNGENLVTQTGGDNTDVISQTGGGGDNVVDQITGDGDDVGIVGCEATHANH
ncbi:curli production assembly [Micractinium conductrix]|uniref:Curli production assembly n=1 Tax=Micractinium conductrix TaxID=554055 RepID=A0A2P6VCU7_9CHLO|nr:curli production assembly [Micractinium conductrix]|eukprot:PSC71915.1 curli production assembly [Micractinium conductrix]